MVGSLLFALVAAQPVAPYLPTPLPYPQELKDQLARERRIAAPGGGHVLFVNFDGAMLTRTGGCNNARTNCSFILSGSSYNFPAYPGTEAQKQAILSRLTTYYGDFDVQVVTTRPTTGNYSMTMVGPGVGVLGPNSGGAAGVAPLDCNDLNQNDVSFAFSDVVGTADTYAIAVTIAQESAHGYGLGHTSNPMDIMYPMLNHRETSFANSSSSIPDNSDCTGTGNQNSYQLLMQNVGPGGPDVTPPTIGFATPHDGDSVPAAFHIQFNASDNRGVVSVELFLDGTSIGGSGTDPWQFDIPAGFVVAGSHKLKGVAKDLAGNVADSGEISVTVKAIGETPGDLGSVCNNDADCPGGFCAFDTGANKHFCTRTCDMMANPCPAGFQCINGGGPMLCAPQTGMGGGSGGGCDVAASTRHGSALAGLLLLGLGAFALVMARIRRN